MEVDTAGWSLASSSHFEVYSQAGAESARNSAKHFEEIRAFFEHNWISQWGAKIPKETRHVRVVEFRNADQYSAVRTHRSADAYYASVDDTNYIAMPVPSATQPDVAAHEYIHYALHAGGTKLPPWLSEGLAEISSTLTITNRGYEFGGAIQERVDLLRRRNWLPSADFFQAEKTVSAGPDQAAIFYAQSWALADMLVFSPQFADKFRELEQRLNSGAAAISVVRSVYGKPSNELLQDARQWVRSGGSQRRRFALPQDPPIPVHITEAAASEIKAVLADLLATNGDWTRARQLYDSLLEQSPRNPAVLASLGSLVLRQGERDRAIRYWQEALAAGLRNADLSYRYAKLADQMNLPPEQVAEALKQVVALRPDFDEARYRIAQIENNRGDYAAALTQLRAITEHRTFGYWAMLASALTELGNREEAVAAAKEAKRVADGPDQFARAAQLAHFAQTDIQVQYTRDASGNLQLAMVRIPHGSAPNPFVEAQDHVKTESGVLGEVQCAEARLIAVVIETAAGPVTLSVPDPSRVQIKAGSSEFTCGPQERRIVVHVEYATADRPTIGVLRGMEVTETTPKPELHPQYPSGKSR